MTLQATLEAVSAELAAPLDLRRFRTNVHVALDAAPFAEEEWEGRRLAVGDADLELLHPCLRCAIPTRDPDTQAKWALLLRHLTDNHSCRFGINARAARPSTIRVGDRVELFGRDPRRHGRRRRRDRGAAGARLAARRTGASCPRSCWRSCRWSCARPAGRQAIADASGVTLVDDGGGGPRPAAGGVLLAGATQPGR